MEFLMDPSIWAGLLTLVVLEIVLGIDNLVFIAILADKLPPKQRDKARLLGLSLALIMRLGHVMDAGYETILLLQNNANMETSDVIGTYVYRDFVELTPEDRDLILKNRAERQPSEQMSTKSKLSLTVEDFLERARYVSFRGYVREMLCLTGEVTSRLKTPRGTWIQFGKHIRCLLSPNAPEEDYKTIGELSRQRQLVSIRGVYEGPDKDNVYIFSNCVLLPYPG